MDDFMMEIQSDELTAPYEPTDQDLLDMEIAWQSDRSTIEWEMDQLYTGLGGASQGNEWLFEI
jgi:hypothetical protein